MTSTEARDAVLFRPDQWAAAQAVVDAYDRTHLRHDIGGGYEDVADAIDALRAALDDPIPDKGPA